MRVGSRAVPLGKPLRWQNELKGNQFDSDLSFLIFFFFLAFFSPLSLDLPEIQEEIYRKDDRLLTLLKDVYVESRDPPAQVSVPLCRRHTSISFVVFKLSTSSVKSKMLSLVLKSYLFYR